MVTGPNRSRALLLGLILLLAAAACAVLPMPLAVRSAAILLLSYVSFAVTGSQMALFIALVAPILGLLSGSEEWLVMLPIILASNLLGMLGLDFAWRYAAVVVSPALVAAPLLTSLILSRQELFMVDLPWADGGTNWLLLHVLVALFGVLAALLLDRRQRNRSLQAADDQPGAA